MKKIEKIEKKFKKMKNWKNVEKIEKNVEKIEKSWKNWKNKEKLKLEMCAKENKKIFQYYIKGDRHKEAPKVGETLLCAGY